MEKKHIIDILQYEVMGIPMRSLLIAALLGTVAVFAPQPSTGAQITDCPQPKRMDHDYPMHELSPKMSLDHYDAVFLGEVAVATRRCTLGFCAGIRVVDKVKGVRGKTLLVQVKPAAVADAGVVPGKCLPDRFRVKGERWLVFGHYGTSAAGTSYLRAEEDGPSYLTAKRPDFNALEGRYLMMRAKLDHAIEERLR